MGFPRREYWSGLPYPPPGDIPDPGIESVSHALAGRFFTIGHLRSSAVPNWRSVKMELHRNVNKYWNRGGQYVVGEKKSRNKLFKEE